MAQGVAPLDTTHCGPIHAAQLDHFGKLLATASEDHSVYVWDVETRQFITELRGHDDHPVWSVAWAHPKFGPMLASGGADGCAVIWRRAEVGDMATAQGEFETWYEVHREKAQGPVMAVAFSPWEHGLQLAMASCDGNVSVLSFRNPSNDPTKPEQWMSKTFEAHVGGTFAVCWAPATSPTAEKTGDMAGLAPQRLVTGGANLQVIVWRYDEGTEAWTPNCRLGEDNFTEWVRDVAWRPNAGTPANTIAACAEDGKVVIWQQRMIENEFRKTTSWQLNASAWQLAWSVTGAILAVSTSDNQVLLYKEDIGGNWMRIDQGVDEGSEDEGHAPASSDMTAEMMWESSK